MFLRIIIIAFYLAWIIYWLVQEKKTYKEKPLSPEKPKLTNILSRIGIRLLFLLVILQLLGLSLFPIGSNNSYQYIGFLVFLIGMAISVSARIALSTNWSNAYEFQIKKGQELISHGIYKYIRHPIYSGISIAFIGAEMVAGSWLWVYFIFILFFGAYLQGKREEKILLAHFGGKYKNYMKSSKMLLPFII